MNGREISSWRLWLPRRCFFGIYPAPIFHMTGGAVEQRLPYQGQGQHGQQRRRAGDGSQPMTDAQFFIDAQAFAPELTLAIGSMLLLLVGVFSGGQVPQTITWACVALLALTAFFVVNGAGRARARLRRGHDRRSVRPLHEADGAHRLSALALDIDDYLRDEKLARFRYPLLVSLATLGML